MPQLHGVALQQSEKGTEVLSSDPVGATGREHLTQGKWDVFQGGGTETGNLMPTAVAYLEEFQVQAAYRMAKVHNLRRTPLDRTWAYPLTEEVLERRGPSLDMSLYQCE